jgi:hypothetical protein
MSDDPAAMLRILFAIPKRQIDHDVALGEQDLNRLCEEVAAILAEQREKNDDPEIDARLNHKLMVQAKAAQINELLPDEYKIFVAASNANMIANESVCAADEKGKIAELSRRIMEIEKREGLEDDEFWPQGEWPDDYQELAKESDQLTSQVSETIFTYVLRRYHLEAIANLFENDRDRYESLFEQGRKWFLVQNK